MMGVSFWANVTINFVHISKKVIENVYTLSHLAYQIVVQYHTNYKYIANIAVNIDVLNSNTKTSRVSQPIPQSYPEGVATARWISLFKQHRASLAEDGDHLEGALMDVS